MHGSWVHCIVGYSIGPFLSVFCLFTAHFDESQCSLPLNNLWLRAPSCGFNLLLLVLKPDKRCEWTNPDAFIIIDLVSNTFPSLLVVSCHLNSLCLVCMVVYLIFEASTKSINYFSVSHWWSQNEFHGLSYSYAFLKH